MLDAAELMREVGARIAEVRRERGLTQNALASKLGTSEKHLQRVESGEENLTLRTLAGYGLALDVPVATFFRPVLSVARKRGRPSSRGPGEPGTLRLAEATPTGMSRSMVPLLTLRAIGKAGTELTSVGTVDWIGLERRASTRGLFVVRVLGAAVAPPIAEGALVVFRAGTTLPKSADFVLVERKTNKGEQSYALKRAGRLGDDAQERIVATLVEVIGARPPAR